MFLRYFPLRFGKGLHVLGGLVILLSGLVGDPLQAAATSKEVEAAATAAVTYLKGAQHPDGSWTYGKEAHYAQGATALVVLSLLTAGVAKDDVAIKCGMSAVMNQPLTHTYSVALAAMAVAAVNPVAGQKYIQQAVDLLVAAQTKVNMWNYSVLAGGGGGGDASNTQMAVLALGEAEKAGAKIPEKTWLRILDYYTSAQNRDGGWGYTPTGNSSPSMTAAGVASLFIVQNRMYKPTACGKFQVDQRRAGGIAWLAQALTQDQGVNHGWGDGYVLYAIERAGILSRQRCFGAVDWYRHGVEILLRSQQPDGSWKDNHVETAFSLLFLVKGKKPLLVAKLRWDGDWNNNPYDVDSLVKYIGSELKTSYDWQVVQTGMPLEELRFSPVLFLNGHQAVTFSDLDLRRLEEFMDAGGVIFAEACCQSPEFDTAIRAVASKLCGGGSLEALPAEHPVYQLHFPIAPGGRILEGLGRGCKISFLYSPKGISCKWDGVCPGGSKNISRDTAMKLGTNVALYAMGEEPLRDRLTPIISKPRHSAGEEPVARGALIWAQIQHAGDCNPDPEMWKNLSEILRGKLNLSVGLAPQRIRLDDPTLRNYPLLYLEGHRAFQLSEPEISGLRSQLENGGTLLAESCCGNPAFDASFRALMKRVLPMQTLTPLPNAHRMLRTPFDVRTVTYSKTVTSATPGLTAPNLECLRLDQRLVVLYSRFGLSCPLDGHPCGACKSYSKESAAALMANLITGAMAGTAEVDGLDAAGN